MSDDQFIFCSYYCQRNRRTTVFPLTQNWANRARSGRDQEYPELLSFQKKRDEKLGAREV